MLRIFNIRSSFCMYHSRRPRSTYTNYFQTLESLTEKAELRFKQLEKMVLFLLVWKVHMELKDFIVWVSFQAWSWMEFRVVRKMAIYLFWNITDTLKSGIEWKRRNFHVGFCPQKLISLFCVLLKSRCAQRRLRIMSNKPSPSMMQMATASFRSRI